MILALLLQNKFTQGSLSGVLAAEWQRGGLMCLSVTGYAAGTGVHSAAAVASLMGFKPTQRQHRRRHNGIVNPLRWETSHASAMINTHRCRCDGVQGRPRARVHVQPSTQICRQFITGIIMLLFPLFAHPSVVSRSYLSHEFVHVAEEN